MKLEPTEAQRKAWADLERAVAWVGMSGTRASLLAVHKAAIGLLAANSITKGPPVGTIARRPDGAWKAERKAGGAGPYWHYSTSAFWQADSPDWNSEDDADSWPVIFTPGEAVGSGPTTDGGETYDPTEPDFSRLNGTDKGAVGFITGLSDERLEELGGFSDPTAQREPALRERFPEQASAYVADPELAEVDDEPLPSGSLITPKPRELPSLDCEEARDETVWRDRDGDRCQYRDELWWFVCDGPETWPIDLQGGRLTDYGPYVEVLS